MKRGSLLILTLALALSWVAPAQAKSIIDLENDGFTCEEVGIPGLSVMRCEKCVTNISTGDVTCTTYHCDKSGNNCKVAAVALPPAPQAELVLDYTIAGVGDVDGDRVPDIAVGHPGQQQVLVFSGADGTVVHSLDISDSQREVVDEQTLTGVGDVDGDRVPDIAVGHPGQRQVRIFSGIDGAVLDTLEDADAQSEPAFGGPLAGVGQVDGDAVVGDIDGDAVPDIAVGHPSQGQVLVFSGADGTVLHTLDMPSAEMETVSKGQSAGEQVFVFGNACWDQTRYVKKGKWRTLVACWNCKATAYFQDPSGAKIKVRYGVGWFGKDSQKQTLNGSDSKALSIGKASVVYARMQIKVPYSTDVTYTYCPVGP